MQVWQPRIPTTQKNLAQSTAELDPGRSRSPTISLQSAEVAYPKNDSKSAAYEIRTKSAQSGGLETNGRERAISSSQPARRSAEVFARSPRLLGFHARSKVGGECWSRKDWRRGRDSNPRYGYPYAAFRVRCFQPLSHLSVAAERKRPSAGRYVAKHMSSAQGRAPSARHGRRAVRSDRKNAPDRSNRRGAPATWHSRRRPDRWRKG